MLLRSYGNIIHHLAQKYDGKVSLSDFRKFEKLTITEDGIMTCLFLKNLSFLLIAQYDRA